MFLLDLKSPYTEKLTGVVFGRGLNMTLVRETVVSLFSRKIRHSRVSVTGK